MAVVAAPQTPRRPITSLSFGDRLACPYPTVTAAFYRHASASSPSRAATAVRDLSGAAPRELTYAQLAGHAQALAARLRGRGVGPGRRVPLVVKRGVEMLVGIWAILSCGAQYVPLDGGVVPDSTIKYVVEQSGGDVVVCMAATEHRLRGHFPGLVPVLVDQAMAEAGPEPPAADDAAGWIDLASPDSGCYVIYTSGTTGKPKGVDVTHRNVANLVCLEPGGLGVRPGMCVGQVLNISFDMAAWEIFACLCNGGTLVVRGSKWEPTMRELDVLICTPSILSKYSPAQYPRIKTVATAGEPTSQALADVWASHATYWNCCGPTETTIVNTMSRHVAGQPVSIGRPTPNNSVYIVDDAGDPVPEGVPGVMWAGGDGVSRGYVGLASKTRESYIPDPFVDDGSSMYCTGDLGRWRLDGNIDILGRCDDQVKIKGFRVELDGVSASLASAPGVTRATALMVDGDLHGFVAPAGRDMGALLEHVGKLQPYYAVPAKMHELDELPTTPNGKIDKRLLRAAASDETPVNTPIEERDADKVAAALDERDVEKAVVLDEKRPVLHVKTASSDCGTLVETRSLSASTLTAVSDSPDLDLDLPGKQLPQPLRGLRLRVLIVYRTLFSLVGLVNVAALVALAASRAGPQWLATLTAANLVTAVLVRQDAVINLLYTLLCSVPTRAPLWLRARCAKVYHLGGVHSGAGVCATAWLLASTLRSTVVYAGGPGLGVGVGGGADADPAGGAVGGGAAPARPESLASIVVSWLLSALLCAMVGFAYPTFRKKHHDLFERLHRFLGWTALCLFWVRTVLAVRDATPAGDDLGLALVRSPGFWMLGVATCSIASSWLFLRRVPVDAVPLSDHAVQLHFRYTVPVNGSFTRLSTRPLLEWHSFATIPADSGYSLVVSNAGDWTRACIRSPPTHVWVRGLPACGVMRIATLFNRVVVIATGSGIGPLLGHISRPTCPTQLIWSTPSPEETFGKTVLNDIRRTIPGAVIHDTRVKGRPDLVKMGYNLATDFGAEAVIIIANEKITKKVVYGLESRGLRAYGAIWDS